MRIKAKDPNLVSLMGEFMRTYLPGVRNRDDDTIASYRYSINLFVAYLEAEYKKPYRQCRPLISTRKI